MINTLEELLQDYARYSCIEDKINPEQSKHLEEDAQNYIKELNKLNLLNIHIVRTTVNCAHENETLHKGSGFIYKTCTDCGEDI